MKSMVELGLNRTGIATSPLDAQDLIEAAQQITPPPGDEHAVNAVRGVYEQETGNVGSVPPPVSLKGVVKTAISAVKGEHMTVFLDKLGERLAFERTGVRLYEALLQKRRAEANGDGEAPIWELERIKEEEAEHFAMLADAIRSIGADPTVETPCADVTAVMSSGIPKVLTEPRTTFTQCLEAMLVVELADNDAWALLADLAEAMGQSELATRFRHALEQEHDHLSLVRRWLARRVMREAGAASEATTV